MNVYSVSIAIKKKRNIEWREWMLTRHIPDVLNTGLFMDHCFQQVVSPLEDDDAFAHYRIDYYYKSAEMLDTYQKTYATTLQQKHTERYAGDFKASRTFLKAL